MMLIIKLPETAAVDAASAVYAAAVTASAEPISSCFGTSV